MTRYAASMYEKIYAVRIVVGKPVENTHINGG
jgi:hypothetical protein